MKSIPDLPVSDSQYAKSKREIERRAAELDNTEDVFNNDKNSNKIPDILKEHFKRNAEAEFHGEKMLSRAHRDVLEEEDLDNEFSQIVESY